MINEVCAELDDLRFEENTYPITLECMPQLMAMLVSELKTMNNLLTNIVTRGGIS